MRQPLSRALLLGGAILVFTAAVSAVGFWKYAHYRYGGLDLAIYTNVVWSLAHGQGWHSSIQGNSYLGDHVEPILLLIAPLFRLWPDPRFLIIIQAFVLGLTAVPIYLLLTRGGSPKFEARNSKQIQNSNFKTWNLFRILASGSASSPEGPARRGPLARRDFGFRISRPVALVGLWFLNPLLWNAALFEFHALAFAPLFLLSAAYFYVQRRFWPFLFFLLPSLSIREDIALVVVMFGIMAAVERWRDVRLTSGELVSPDAPSAEAQLPLPAAQRGEPNEPTRGGRIGGVSPTRARSNGLRRERLARSGDTTTLAGDHVLPWVIIPIVLGVCWFLIAMRIAAAHSASGFYKFLIYYGWLRDALDQPLMFLRHFASLGNLDMILGLLLPFLLLPLLRPRWLLLALTPFLQFFLAAGGGSALVVELHYSLLFLPALVLATAEAITTWGEHANASNSGYECSQYVRRNLKHSDRAPPAGGGWSRSIRMFLLRRFPLPKPFAIGLGVAVYLAIAWMLGPFPGIAQAIIRGATPDERTRAAAYNELLQIVQSRALDKSDASIAAGYAALPHIAARQGAYALSYAYLSVNQYAFAPYQLPPDLRFILLDQRDALAYAIQFPGVRWSAPYAADGPARLRRIIGAGGFGLNSERHGVALLERSRGGPLPDQRYFAPAGSVRARLGVDALRDITLMIE